MAEVPDSPNNDAPTTLDQIKALPPFTVFAMGWRTPSGRVQGSTYMRVGGEEIARYVGPPRDRHPVRPAPDDEIAVIAEPAAPPDAAELEELAVWLDGWCDHEPHYGPTCCAWRKAAATVRAAAASGSPGEPK